jgi:hypothetical protein
VAAYVAVAGVVVPGRRVLLVLVLVVALTCSGEWVTVANVAHRWSTFDGLVTAYGGLGTTWLSSRVGFA